MGIVEKDYAYFYVIEKIMRNWLLIKGGEYGKLQSTCCSVSEDEQAKDNPNNIGDVSDGLDVVRYFKCYV